MKRIRRDAAIFSLHPAKHIAVEGDILNNDENLYEKLLVYESWFRVLKRKVMFMI